MGTAETHGDFVLSVVGPLSIILGINPESGPTDYD